MKQRERRWAVERGALSARLVEMESSFAEQVKELRRQPSPNPTPTPNPTPNPNPKPQPQPQPQP